GWVGADEPDFVPGASHRFERKVVVGEFRFAESARPVRLYFSMRSQAAFLDRFAPDLDHSGGIGAYRGYGTDSRGYGQREKWYFHRLSVPGGRSCCIMAYAKLRPRLRRNQSSGAGSGREGQGPDT